jgi:hypothetical protein
MFKTCFELSLEEVFKLCYRVNLKFAPPYFFHQLNNNKSAITFGHSDGETNISAFGKFLDLRSRKIEKPNGSRSILRRKFLRRIILHRTILRRIILRRIILRQKILRSKKISPEVEDSLPEYSSPG